MLHAVRDVPPYDITSFVDVEEARVDRAREEIRVKRSISMPHPRPIPGRSFLWHIVASQLAGGRHPHTSGCGPRMLSVRNVDRLESVLREDVAVKLQVGSLVHAGDCSLWRNP